MADKNKQVRLRATKEETFNVLKAAAPGLFGTYVWTDVDTFTDDPNDSSKFLIEFNEEPDT